MLRARIPGAPGELAGQQAIAVLGVERVGHGRVRPLAPADAGGHLSGRPARCDRERPEPELLARDDAVVRVEATGVCGSDLHIYHGRVAIEPGFTLGHEFVGTVTATGDAVEEVADGDRVLGCYCSACGNCFFAAAGVPQVRRRRVSGTARRSARSRRRPSSCWCRMPT